MEIRRLAGRAKWLLYKAGIVPAYRALTPPQLPGLRLTPKRLLNYWLVTYQRSRGHTKLRGRPLYLTFEATNVCNLHCPYCFTGIGDAGRERSMMSLDTYQRLLDELGDYALQIDFYNWGEPLLNKNIYEMIRLASAKGLSTVISTNFSVPFDAERAEKLVQSGLAALGAGVDGASQETLEQYRVGAKFDKVIENLRLLVEAKQRLGSKTPVICWSFHVFDHNKHEIEQARAMAQELGIDFAATKGWVAGEEQSPDSGYHFPVDTGPQAARCKYLWTYAIVNNDGKVAPCAAAFYEEDDFGSAAEGAFRRAWNNETFQEARKLFASRADASARGRQLICYECPYTTVWEDYQRHRAQGGTKASFHTDKTTNDWFNYFFERRRPSVVTTPPPDAIGLEPVDTPATRR